MVKTVKEHVYNFNCSCVAVVTACVCTNPVDVIKVRLQLDNQLASKKNIFEDRYYKGFVRGGIQIFKDEGFAGWFKGVLAAAIREGTYSTFRLGSYEPVKHYFGATEPCAPLYKLIAAGAIIGGIGSAMATPFDLVKIRIQGEGRLPPGVPTQYPSTFGLLRDIAKKEGVKGLYRGIGPTVFRASVLTAAQIPAYDYTKNQIKYRDVMHEGFPLHVVASFIAGFVTAVVTSPIDVVKTRIMHENTLQISNLKYTSSFSACYKILRSEGILGFYKGFIPNWLRLTPHTIITFIVYERLRKFAGLKPV